MLSPTNLKITVAIVMCSHRGMHANSGIDEQLKRGYSTTYISRGSGGMLQNINF